MDRRFALLIVGVTLFVIIFLVGCVSPSLTPPPPSPPCARDAEKNTEKNTWKCSPTAGFVTRNVTIVAPPQGGGELEITALPLPTEALPPPPKEKNITRLVTVVIEPQVRIKGTSKDVITFQPPLTVTMEFTSEDVKDVPRADGKPQLSIISYYKDGNTWHWEKLETTVVCKEPKETKEPCNQGTLTSVIYTLQPKDAEGEGY